MIKWGKTTRDLLGRAQLSLRDRTKRDEKERNGREDKWIEGKGSGGV